jgi:hypothetical protein
VSDDDLRSASYALSYAMSEMLAADGIDPDIIGIPDQMDGDVFARSFEIDAELYMSMNLDRLKDEYEEILDAANATKWESDPGGLVGSAKTDIEAWWVGPCTDVDSPAFQYDQFFYSLEPGVHGPEVERER